jgi:hypothetical protein
MTHVRSDNIEVWKRALEMVKGHLANPAPWRCEEKPKVKESLYDTATER